jgi:hypothetical protein
MILSNLNIFNRQRKGDNPEKTSKNQQHRPSRTTNPFFLRRSSIRFYDNDIVKESLFHSKYVRNSIYLYQYKESVDDAETADCQTTCSSCRGQQRATSKTTTYFTKDNLFETWSMIAFITLMILLIFPPVLLGVLVPGTFFERWAKASSRLCTIISGGSHACHDV